MTLAAKVSQRKQESSSISRYYNRFLAAQTKKQRHSAVAFCFVYCDIQIIRMISRKIRGIVTQEARWDTTVIPAAMEVSCP